ncbi:MAG: ATP-dependent RecD-like DNA helicase [Clostridiales bacterium]|nr:ATP-dependent RecD-like DNA helicase [Clostridiales bacterium]
MIKEGKLGKIIFNNSDNGYTVAILTTDEGSIRVAGVFNEPKTGSSYRLEGRFTVHKRYGEQFSFISYEEIQPEGIDAIREFLAAGNIRGIGPKMADTLIDTFGDEALAVIENSPEKLLSLRGIGPSRLANITESFAESRDFAKISLVLRELGIEMADAVRIYKMYGGESERVVKDNPYALVDDLYGMTFSKADKLAEKLGFDSESEFRIESGIKFILKKEASSGSTLMPENMLVESVVELIDASSERVREVVKQMAFAGELQMDMVDDIQVVYLYGYYYAEQRVAYNLKRIKEAEPKAVPATIDNLISDAEKDLADEYGRNIKLSNEQRYAVKASLMGSTTIITGGPGTGKTTIINVLVRIFHRLDMTIALSAPTGRAAKRMQEASGEPAMTIHRLLEYVYSVDEDEMRFGRTDERPLEQEVFIIDEASMIDIMLMDGLLNAIKSGSIVIFTGDADQLPPVGAGNVLRDMIASEYIYTVCLKEIFRQAQDSRIATNAHLINNGEFPETGGHDSDFFIIERYNEDDIIEEIKGLVGGRLERFYDFIKSADDIQVLTPTKRGILGSPSLNSILQEIINPAAEGEEELKMGPQTFRKGDKVMQLKNDYQAERRDTTNLEIGQGIFNGDLGKVDSINLQERSMLVSSDDNLITYEGEMFDEVDLAYAITVHKSQGSEFPAVIIPMWHIPPMLMTRNLLYTAITRGKKLVIIVGDPKYLHWMISNNRADSRFTGLKHKLVDLDAFDKQGVWGK